MSSKKGLTIVKTRSWSQPLPYGETRAYLLSDGTYNVVGPPGSADKATFWEQIAYVNGGKLAVNPCIHESIATFTPSPGMTVSFWYTALAPTVRQELPAAHAIARIQMPFSVAAFDTAIASYQTRNTVLGVNAQLYLAQVWDKLTPTLTDVSVPNFLIDLAQLRLLFRLGRRSREVRQNVKNVANANLNIQFGWIPTLGDIQAAYYACKGLHDKLKAWNDRLGIRTTRRVKVLKEVVSKSGVHTLAERQSTWTGRLDRSVYAFIKFIPQPIAALSELELNLRGLLQSLGFRLNAGIIWDAIPFSFVVDWFVNVGGLLSNLNIDTLTLPIKLEEVYLQYKERYFLETQVAQVANSDHKRIEYSSGLYERKYFHRMVARPDMTLLLTSGWKFPTINQAVLGLSLATSAL